MREDSLVGWKITPVFSRSQKQREILALLKRYFNCGRIRVRKKSAWFYEVDNRTALKTHSLPFFKNSRFLSIKKKADFARFQKILEIWDGHSTTTWDDLKEILALLDEIESKSKRKDTNGEILERATLFWEKNCDKMKKELLRWKILSLFFLLNTKMKNPQRLHAKHSLKKQWLMI